jgi:hypothetical protein
MPGRDSRSRRPRVFHTQATAVLGSLAAYSQFNFKPDTLPPSTNWEGHAAEGQKHREDCHKAINALNTVLIPDQKLHGIPTGTDLDGNGDITEGVEPSEVFLQLCTVLSRDPTLNTKTNIVQWSKKKPEFSLLRDTLKKGKWPEKDQV